MTPKGVPHRVQGSVDAAEPPSEMMPQSHLAPFTSFHGAVRTCCAGLVVLGAIAHEAFPSLVKKSLTPFVVVAAALSL